MFETDEKVIVARVKDYGPKPRGAKQALIQAHAFLAEEGQWVAGEFFRDGDPKEAYEKAACSSWAACSMGALGLVTGESPVRVLREFWSSGYDEPLEENDFEYQFIVHESYNEHETPISYRAAKALALVIDPESLENGEDAVDVVIQHNDRNDYLDSRTRVLDAFAAAIRNLGGEPLVDHRKVKHVRKYLARKRKAG